MLKILKFVLLPIILMQISLAFTTVKNRDLILTDNDVITIESISNLETIEAFKYY